LPGKRLRKESFYCLSSPFCLQFIR